MMNEQSSSEGEGDSSDDDEDESDCYRATNFANPEEY